MQAKVAMSNAITKKKCMDQFYYNVAAIESTAVSPSRLIDADG